MPRPVVLVRASNAEDLMGLVNKNEEAKVTIDIMMEVQKWVSRERESRCGTILLRNIVSELGSP